MYPASAAVHRPVAACASASCSRFSSFWMTRHAACPQASAKSAHRYWSSDQPGRRLTRGGVDLGRVGLGGGSDFGCLGRLSHPNMMSFREHDTQNRLLPVSAQRSARKRPARASKNGVINASCICRQRRPRRAARRLSPSGCRGMVADGDEGGDVLRGATAVARLVNGGTGRYRGCDEYPPSPQPGTRSRGSRRVGRGPTRRTARGQARGLTADECATILLLPQAPHPTLPRGARRPQSDVARSTVRSSPRCSMAPSVAVRSPPLCWADRWKSRSARR